MPLWLIIGLFVSNAYAGLSIRPAGSSDNAYYEVGGRSFLLEIDQEGAVFYRDGLSFKEPPANVLASLFEHRSRQLEQGGRMSPERHRFLKNSSYKALFDRTPESKTVSIAVEKEGVFQVVGSKRNKILSVDGGRLVVEDMVLVDGVYWKAYRALDPEALKKLMARYGTAPETYASILKHPSNLEDMKWFNDRVQNSPVASAPAAPVEVPKPEIKNSAAHVASGETPVQPATPRPVAPAAPAGKPARRFVPSWAKTSSQIASYLSASDENPLPAVRASDADGLPEEYNQLRSALDRKTVELTRNMAAGSPESEDDILMDQMQNDGDALHRFWARRIHALGGKNKLSPQERARYDADLEDFEYTQIGFRYQKMFTRRLDERIAAGKGAFVPTAEDEQLQLRALEEVVAVFRKDPITYAETKSRLKDLAQLKMNDSKEARLKYPKLSLFLWQLAAKEWVTTQAN